MKITLHNLMCIFIGSTPYLVLKGCDLETVAWPLSTK